MSALLCSLLLASAAADGVHAPAPVAPDPVPADTTPTPDGQADVAVEQVDLPPLPAATSIGGFSNPFRQYEGGSIPGWAYGGDATLFNDYLSLTPSAPHKLGWIWSTSPANLSTGWEVQFEFHIGGSPSRGAGGGLALWWTEEPGVVGTTYGHTDSFKGLGIFFDTYEASPTETEPYIVAVVNDGSPLHADAESAPPGLHVKPEIAAKQIAVCFSKYRNLATIGKARVAYDGEKLEMWVDLDHSGTHSTWQSCLRTEPGDLRLSYLPKVGYFGMSATTGAYGDAHVVYAWRGASLHNAGEVVATPHVLAPGEAAPTHQVTKAASDEQTAVPIASTELPPGIVEGDAHKQSAPEHQPVHLPPVQEANEQMDHVLAALESNAQMREVLEEVRENVGEILMFVHHLPDGALMHAKPVELPPAMPALSGDVAASFATSFAEVKASLGALSTAVHGVSKEMDGISKTLTAHEAVLQSVEKAGHRHMEHLAEALGGGNDVGGDKSVQLRGIENSIGSVKAELAALKSTVESVREDVSGVRTLARGSIEEIRKDAKDLHRKLDSAGSSGGGVFPLAVCAQALVVTALFANRCFMGRGKSHSHLP
jgi:archaellum component FlaC